MVWLISCRVNFVLEIKHIKKKHIKLRIDMKECRSYYKPPPFSQITFLSDS